ncbi:MAG: DUF5063 domain-containing protein [Fermentimonas sp.]|nr:DUF5063 domain-containing protein [Fermentimonas sp.]
MKKRDIDEIVYDKNVIEFLTVAVNFCSLLESDEKLSRSVWIEKMLKILPLMYLKASLLPETIETFEEPPAPFVREEDYARVVNIVSEIMGEEDIYLDVFIEEMKYSDRPISATVSENIADIYQDVRNFVSVYQMELSDQMQSAINICTVNFRTYWGQKLVNVLRPLHTLKSKEFENTDYDDLLNIEDSWD